MRNLKLKRSAMKSFQTWMFIDDVGTIGQFPGSYLLLSDIQVVQRNYSNLHDVLIIETLAEVLHRCKKCIFHLVKKTSAELRNPSTTSCPAVV